MSEPADRWERGIEALKAQSRDGAGYDVTLEKRIMHEFSKGQTRRRRRFAALAAAAIVVAVSGLGIAAAGGIEAVKGWFGAIELVSPDGTTQRFNIQGTELVDEQGNTIGQLHVVPGGDGFVPHLNAAPSGGEQKR
ncbi:MAG: hypothetical protein U0836_14860 [Pirellulales bacterium]